MESNAVKILQLLAMLISSVSSQGSDEAFTSIFIENLTRFLV